jgi:SLOG in TRPM, prokaryote
MLAAMTDAVRDVGSEVDLIDALGPAPADGRALILIGGADATEHERHAALQAFFMTLARHCEQTGTTVVDGGTDSGVMRFIGDARTAIGGTFRLIGVAPAGAFERPTKAGTRIKPAPNHSLILRVPGGWFGDETRWLFAAADHIGRGSAATIVVNGGKLTFDEAHQRMAAGHPVIAIQGSGRAADELADDEALRTSGKLRVMRLTIDDAELNEFLRA